MTIRHMQIFEAVCENKSITAAADTLNMTQPAVSIAIRELESYYNVKLFDRIGRRIYLTEAGQTLRRYAESMLEQFDEAAVVLRSGGGFMRCRLGVNVSVGETILPDILDLLEKRIPGIKVEIYIGNTRIIERKLSMNDIDIAIADCIAESSDRHIEDFYTGEVCIVASPEATARILDSLGEKKQLSIADLSRQRLLLREEGSGSRISLEAVFRACGCATNPVTVSTSDLCLLNLARRGFGVTILPRELVESDLINGTLCELHLADTLIKRRYFLAYNRRKPFTGIIAESVEVLRGGLDKH